MEYLIQRFQTLYIPQRNISVDEQLMLHKGRLSFKQYIPKKRSRFGIKFFSLCDTTGYLWDSIIYVGKQTKQPSDELIQSLGKSGSIVIQLAEKLLGKGYRLYLDNWYTSVALARYLSKNQTGICGTIRKNRGKFPASFTTSKLERGSAVFVSKKNIMAIRYKDRKDVYLISTLHKPEVAVTKKKKRDGTPIEKFTIIDDYNKNMGGVDTNDGCIANYSGVRKSHKWTTKIALHFIEEAVFNAFLLYRYKHQKAVLLDFKLSIIGSMISYQPETNNQKRSKKHKVDKIPNTPSKKTPTRRCVHCSARGSKKRAETRYQCIDCTHKPALCIIRCFDQYHGY